MPKKIKKPAVSKMAGDDDCAFAGLVNHQQAIDIVMGAVLSALDHDRLMDDIDEAWDREIKRHGKRHLALNEHEAEVVRKALSDFAAHTHAGREAHIADMVLGRLQDAELLFEKDDAAAAVISRPSTHRFPKGRIVTAKKPGRRNGDSR